MKIKKYTNGAWTDLDTPVKKFDEYTDEATTLPLTIETSKTNAVENYQVYGTSEGAGVETENLFDWKKVKLNTGVAWVTGEEVQNDGHNLSDYIPVESADYTASFNVYFLFYDEQKEYVGRYDGFTFAKTGGVETFSKIPIPYTGYIRILTLRAIDDLKTFMFIKNSSLPETYIPHGYKIPILNTSGEQQSNYDLFIGDSKLYEDEYLDFSEQKIYRTIILTTHDNKNFITSDNKRFCVRRSNNG